MSLRMLDEGAIAILQTFFGTRGKDVSWSVKLFTSPTDPLTDDLVGADFIEATGANYPGDMTIEPADAGIGLSEASPDGIAQVEFPELEWTFGGPLDGDASIYGYVIMAGSIAIYAEMLAKEFTPQNEDDILSVTPIFKLGNLDDAAEIAL